MTLIASVIYAQSQNSRCNGSHRCHWCGAPAQPMWFHDDPPPVPFVTSRSSALFPEQAYVCQGCWLFKRQRITVHWLSGGIRDGQCPRNHSWLITPEGSKAVSRHCRSKLLEVLLKPPPMFCLALLESSFEHPNEALLRNGRPHPLQNHLHLFKLNEVYGVEANTPLHFTLNNIPHKYTIYELEEGIKGRSAGMEPGVGALLRLLKLEPTPIPAHLEEVLSEGPEKRKVGRPPAPEKPHKVVRLSGQQQSG